MKKTLFTILAAAAVLASSTATAFAAGPGCGRFFVDANGDGICDNAGAGCAFVDANGDGICDNAGAGRGRGAGWGRGAGCGRNFVDANGDGVCDYYASSQG